MNNVRLANATLDAAGSLQRIVASCRRNAPALVALERDHPGAARVPIVGASFLVDILRNSPTLLGVTAEMQSVLDAAVTDMPEQPLRPEELPWPTAIVFGERPFTKNPVVGPANWSCAVDTLAWTSDRMSDVAQSYSDPADKEWFDAVWCGIVWVGWVAGLHQRSIGGLTRWREGEPPSGPDDPPHHAENHRRLACLWSMVQQRIAVIEPVHQVSRAAVRRSHREHVDPLKLCIVRLRRGPSSSASGGGEDTVEWTHRWITKGHWRQHWFPSLGEHRPLWIDEHIKGPEDRPLVIKDRVHLWSR